MFGVFKTRTRSKCIKKKTYPNVFIILKINKATMIHEHNINFTIRF